MIYDFEIYYIGSLILILFLLNLSFLKEGSGRITGVVSSAIFVSVLFSFRDISSGNDTIYYYGYFEYIIDNGLLDFYRQFPRHTKEALFWTMTWSVTKFTSEPLIIILVLTAVSVLICTLCVYKLSKDNVYAVVFLLISFSFYSLYANILRQGFATSLFLLTLLLVTRNKIWWATSVAIMSTMMHPSGIVSVILVLSSILKCKSKHLLALSVLSFVLSTQIVSIVSYIPILKDFSGYIVSGQGRSSIGFGLLSFFIIYPIAEYARHKGRLGNEVVFSYLLMFSIQIVFMSIHDVAFRMSLYRYALEPIIFGSALTLVSGTFKRFIVCTISGVYFLVMLKFTPALSFIEAGI